MRTMRRTGWTLLLGLCTAYACGSPSRDYGGDSLGGGGGALPSGGAGGLARGGSKASGGEFSAGSGGMGMAGTGPEGGTDGGGAQGGAGGEGGELVAPPQPARPGNAVVAAGFYMKSARYSLLSSVGESPGGNGVYSSRKYRLHGGIVGTTQP